MRGLTRFLVLLKSEIKRRQATLFNAKHIYVALAGWPLFIFFTFYFQYSSFEIKSSIFEQLKSKNDILVFLQIGILNYLCFWLMLQSGIDIVSERYSGSLETVLLSPVNRLMFIYSRAGSVLLEEAWIFFMITALGALFLIKLTAVKLILMSFSFVLMFISSVFWGGLMNVLCMWGRNMVTFFFLVNEPSKFITGVTIPIQILPGWLQIISNMFPLTHCINFMRHALLTDNYSLLIKDFVYLLLTNISVFLVTILAFKLVEKKQQKDGSLSFY